MKRMGRSKSLSENQVIIISLPDSYYLSLFFSPSHTLTHTRTHTHALSISFKYRAFSRLRIQPFLSQTLTAITATTIASASVDLFAPAGGELYQRGKLQSLRH